MIIGLELYIFLVDYCGQFFDIQSFQFVIQAIPILHCLSVQGAGMVGRALGHTQHTSLEQSRSIHDLHDPIDGDPFIFLTQEEPPMGSLGRGNEVVPGQLLEDLGQEVFGDIQTISDLLGTNQMARRCTGCNINNSPEGILATFG